jgi:hypothetical protein
LVWCLLGLKIFTEDNLLKLYNKETVSCHVDFVEKDDHGSANLGALKANGKLRANISQQWYIIELLENSRWASL